MLYIKIIVAKKALYSVRMMIYRIPQPDAISIESSLGYSIIQSEHPGGLNIVPLFPLLLYSLGDGHRFFAFSRWFNIVYDIFLVLGFGQYLYSLRSIVSQNIMIF
jgi:hypothetical protein